MTLPKQMTGPHEPIEAEDVYQRYQKQHPNDNRLQNDVHLEPALVLAHSHETYI